MVEYLRKVDIIIERVLVKFLFVGGLTGGLFLVKAVWDFFVSR